MYNRGERGIGGQGDSMRNSHLHTELLDEERETRLAQEIEAGVLAHHLLVLGRADPPDTDAADAAELAELVAVGERAKSEFLLANLGLVGLAANATARRTGLDEDELFQEGFLGLVEALQRFDHQRGCRFSTYAMAWIKSRILQAAQTRLGGIELPLARIAKLRLLLQHQGELTQREHREVGVVEAGADLGLTRSWARDLAHLQRERLDDVGDVAVVADELGEDEGDVRALLALLSPRQRRLVELRFGFRGVAQPRGVVARLQGVSVREVRRVELQALDQLRGIVVERERPNTAA